MSQFDKYVYDETVEVSLHVKYDVPILKYLPSRGLSRKPKASVFWTGVNCSAINPVAASI